MNISAPLLLAALLMGISASPHCALMCGAPCASLSGGSRRSGMSFHIGRVLGYALAGAVVASSVALLAEASKAAPALRPLWQLMHLGFVALGLWWLATGRPLRSIRQSAALPLRFLPPGQRQLRAGLAGLGWVALPCGVLQGALLLAALASDPLSGALVMGVFALASMPALALAPWAWARWQAHQQKHLHKHQPAQGLSSAQATALGLRVAGAGLVLMSGWALTQGLWMQLTAWCLG